MSDQLTITQPNDKILLSESFDNITLMAPENQIIDFGNVVVKEIGVNIFAKTEKAIPVQDDIVLIEDSGDSYYQKKVKLKYITNGGTF